MIRTAGQNQIRRTRLKSWPSPMQPLVVIKVAQQIGPAPLTAVVPDYTYCRDDEHNRAGSHTHPGLVHIGLLRYTRFSDPTACGSTPCTAEARSPTNPERDNPATLPHFLREEPDRRLPEASDESRRDSSPTAVAYYQPAGVFRMIPVSTITKLRRCANR